MPLTPKQRVALACKIIGPAADRAAIEGAVGELDAKLWRLRVMGSRNFYMPKGKDQKKTAEQLRNALVRVETLLPRLWHKLHFSLQDDFDVERWLAELKRLKAATEAFTEISLGQPKRHDAADKREAALMAVRLLAPHGLPSRVQRAGQLCRLAAALYGNAKADLSEHCRAAIRV